MNEPKLPTTHPLVTAVAKQLVDAIEMDNTDISFGSLGPNATKVLAEIVSAAAPKLLKLTPEAEAKLNEALSAGGARPGQVWYREDPEVVQLRAEVARLNTIIKHPEHDDFIRGVSIEAEYQRCLHGVDASEGRFDWHQWYWVVGYLLGKALAACKSGEGDGEKARHHLVTSAALINNWHNVLTGKAAASVHSNGAKPVADMTIHIPGNGHG